MPNLPSGASGVPDPTAAEALASELLNQGIPLEIIPQQLVESGLVRSYTEGQEALSSVQEQRAEAAALSAEVFGDADVDYQITRVEQLPGGRQERITVGVEVPGLNRPYYGTIVVDKADTAERRRMIEEFAEYLEADYAEHYEVSE